MDLDPNDHPPIDRAVSTRHPPAAPPRIPTPQELRQLREVDLSPRINAAIQKVIEDLRASTEPEGPSAGVREERPVLQAAARQLTAAGWACEIKPGGARDNDRTALLIVREAQVSGSGDPL